MANGTDQSKVPVEVSMIEQLCCWKRQVQPVRSIVNEMLSALVLVFGTSLQVAHHTAESTDLFCDELLMQFEVAEELA